MRGIARRATWFGLLVLSAAGAHASSLSTPSADGVPIRYLSRGAGRPALILVSGFAGTKEEWQPQIDEFSRRHRVVALDLAGFGESGNQRAEWTMAAFGADVVAVVDALELDDVVLVGHSMGSAAVVEAARRLGGRVAAVVPVDVMQSVGARRTPEEIAARVERSMSFAKDPDRGALRAAFREPIDEETLDRMIEEVRAADHSGWRESLHDYFRWVNDDLTTALAELTVPIHCINSDRMPTDVEAARRHAAHFEVRIVPGVGHAVMIEAPDAFNEQLSDVIAALVAGPADPPPAVGRP